VSGVPGRCTRRRVILHLDLDAFYASVEVRDDPSLRGRAVVVGGLGPRGVVAAASYEARRHGVASAMPMARARRAVPGAVFLAPRFEAYQQASRSVMAILRDVTPLVEPLSLDEAFLDVSGARRRSGTGPEIARALRERIRRETGLVASVGVAGTKMLAKIASDLSKPDGLLVVEPGEEEAFLRPLPVRRLWGVGPATGRRLAALGVGTVGDLADLPVDTVIRALGPSAGRHLHALAHNLDDRPVVPEREVKSIGHEETFPSDISRRDELERHLNRMSDRVASRLRAGGVVARTVQLKLRYGDFHTLTRSATLPEPTDRTVDLAAVARRLLAGLDVEAGVRLIGVSGHNLARRPLVQDELPFGAPGPAAPTGVGPTGAAEPGPGRDTRPLDRAVDAVRARFGEAAVGSAALVGHDGLEVGRRGSLWGPDAGEREDRSARSPGGAGSGSRAAGGGREGER